MDSEDLVHKLKERLVCPVCRDEYTNPRSLPCLHTFCFKCLTQLVNRSTLRNHIACPVCKQNVKLPVDGASGFPMSFLHLDLKEQVSGAQASNTSRRLICGTDSCDKEARFYCRDGCEALCEVCYDHHQRFRATSDHMCIELRNRRSTAASALRKKMCKKHPGEEVKMHCRDCGVELCMTCAFTEHRFHSVQAGSGRHGGADNMLHHLVKELNESINIREQCKHITQHNGKKADQNLNELKSEIIKLVEDLHENLDIRKEDIIKMINENIETVQKRVSEAVKTSNETIHTLNILRTKTDTCLTLDNREKADESMQSIKDEFTKISDSPPKQLLWKIDREQVPTSYQNQTVANLDMREFERIALCAAENTLTALPKKKIIDICGIDGKTKQMLLMQGHGFVILEERGYLAVINFREKRVHQLHVEGLIDPQSIIAFPRKMSQIAVSDGRQKKLFWINITFYPEKCVGQVRKTSNLQYIPGSLALKEPDLLLVTENECRKIHFLNQAGDEIRSIQLHEDICPIKVTSNPNTPGYIVLSHQQITWFSSDGIKQNDHKRTSSFDPVDIAHDQNSTMWICNGAENRLEVMGLDGKYLKKLINRDLQIVSPTCIAIDPKENHVYFINDGVGDEPSKLVQLIYQHLPSVAVKICEQVMELQVTTEEPSVEQFASIQL